MSSCNKNMTYDEKELNILREAVDIAQDRAGKKIIRNPQVKEIITIVEDFLKDNKTCCYGGTAINNILPTEDQFYDKSVELPDYDFFSPNALDDAKKLADIYYKAGFDEVEAKAGVHHGTYKVFVNFLAVADITHMDTHLFNQVYKDSIKVNNIHYAPPDYLRMAAYLELSRPAGDVSRWEKVMKRVSLLNKNYPMKNPRCDDVQFQRSMEEDGIKSADIFTSIRDSFIDQGLVFFGGYASSLYSKYMPKKYERAISKIPDFDILAEDPNKAAIIVKERLSDNGIKNVKIIQKEGAGEIIAPHVEIRIGVDALAFIYQPLACHSYNIVKIGKKKIKVATIDTMLSMYLAFIYANRPYYNKDRILCMAQYLFQVQQKNRLQQKGVLRRFSVNCYGKQSTLESIRNEKSEKFKELEGKRGTREYEEWFMRYVPNDNDKSNNKEKGYGKKSKKGNNNSKKGNNNSKKGNNNSKKGNNKFTKRRPGNKKRSNKNTLKKNTLKNKMNPLFMNLF